MKLHRLLIVLLLFVVVKSNAQQTETKYYPKYTKAGEVYVLYDYGVFASGVSQRIYTIDVPREKYFYISGLANLRVSNKLKVIVDNVTLDVVYPVSDGWQNFYVTRPVLLSAGKHDIRFAGQTVDLPMIEQITLSTTPLSGRGTDPAADRFLTAVAASRQAPRISTPTVDETGDLTTKVLPNPQGQYDHAIDTAFGYSHYSWVYLTAGTHSFSTINSTAHRSLTVFNPTNFTYSWSNVNGGPGGESALNLIVGLAGYYSIMLRPYTTATGVTDIVLDGSVIVNDAIIGGRTYAMSSLKGGPLNFFTCRLTTGDTRMIASRYFASSARAYNDDYVTGGDWSWGLASRIRKDFATDSVQYGFVCAYSPTSTGVSDVYLGNLNSEVNNTNYPEFPLLKPDDAIRSANNTGVYNCISWSGGITSGWAWPPSSYSTYNCTGNYNDVTCFDNFYSNNPVRYPGAWNFTRTGANVNNSVVDLWALNGSYTHASVRKPGNNHPHGYDWESKPGSTARTFHPRNALTNLSGGYGGVVNYYIHAGSFARNVPDALSFETDADAVRAGVAIFDVAHLSGVANEKLNTLLRKGDYSFTSRFNELYEAWKNTWAANMIYSDPAMYCKNNEFAALAAYAEKNLRQAMLLVFDKFVNGNDHPIGELMLTLTKAKYGHLLQEVKTERLAKPNDEAGRYRIHGDHDNGVLYVEKILKQLEMQADQPIVTSVDNINVIVSPNPVKDRLTVQFTTTHNSRASVTVISSQTGQKRVLQPETELAPGTHRFNLNIQGFAGASGDMLAVQVMIDGALKTVKVLVTK
ncbi:MAG: hypothetical protein NTW29_08545 [Bacteroidetes bacterium]|nr:hypothetical protein [Bacteroidota bacterium]